MLKDVLLRKIKFQIQMMIILNCKDLSHCFVRYPAYREILVVKFDY